MRIMNTIALGTLLLLAPTAQAKNRGHKKADAKVAVVDDEPMPNAAQKQPVSPASMRMRRGISPKKPPSPAAA